MKRIIVLFSLSFTLFSCQKSPIPQDIQIFLSNLILKEEDVKSGHFMQTLHEEVEGKIGDNTIDFVFARKNEADFSFKAIYTFTGNQIKDGINSKIVELKYLQNQDYQFDVTINGDLSSEVINREKAWGYYYQIFDNGANPYRFGGLYYGDLIAVKANQFYPKYTLNESKDRLTFNETDAEYVTGILLNQKIEIDQKGMLIAKEEHARSKEIASNFTDVIQTGEYEYN